MPLTWFLEVSFSEEAESFELAKDGQGFTGILSPARIADKQPMTQEPFNWQANFRVYQQLDCQWPLTLKESSSSTHH
jgi:hypothetical protein